MNGIVIIQLSVYSICMQQVYDIQQAMGRKTCLAKIRRQEIANKICNWCCKKLIKANEEWIIID